MELKIEHQEIENMNLTITTTMRVSEWKTFIDQLKNIIGGPSHSFKNAAIDEFKKIGHRFGEMEKNEYGSLFEGLNKK